MILSRQWQKFDGRTALRLTIGGVPGVLLAAYLVKSLPLGTVRWLVVVVVIYTSALLIRSAVIERRPASFEKSGTNKEFFPANPLL